MHHSIKPIFYGAKLIALSKKDNGIRPIAIGETLRRLTAKIAIASVQKAVSARLSPTQLGFGIAGGTKAAVHATRAFVETLNQNSVLIKLDFANAFNTIRRDHVAEKM